MSGVETLAIIGLVNNIVSFVDYGKKVLDRLHDFEAHVTEVPNALRDIKTGLPLLLNTLGETKDQAKASLISEDVEAALSPVVDGCREQVEELEGILLKIVPTETDHKWQVRRKALSSVHQEKKVKAIGDTLQRYVQLLTYYQATKGAGGLDLKNYLHTTRSRSPRSEARTLFLVPFERDHAYIDRTGIMQELDKKSKSHRRISLAGIGGVGKSQIAIEYCYRFYRQNPTSNVFWIHAANLAQLDQGYRNIARKLSLPGWDELDLNTFQAVFDWLSDIEHGSWLMVLDSADDLDLFFTKSSKDVKQEIKPQMSRFIPRSSLGTVMITTRDKRVAERLADRQAPVQVLPMSGLEAQDLLRSKLPEELVLDATEVAALVDALGHLPLAISQAAAFITENSMDLGQYLEAFKSDVSQVQDLLSEDLGDHRRYSDSESSIFSTWKLSFDQISKQQPRAAEILSLMAVLDRNAVPKSLLIKDNERAIDFTLALGILQAFSLIVSEKDSKFGIHRLVQLSTQRWLQLQNSFEHWQEIALRAISAHFPLGDYKNWPQCEALSQHAQVVIRYEYRSDSCLVERARVLHNLARFDDQQSRYTLAHARYTEAITARKRLLGVEDPATLQSICMYGRLLFHESNYPDAEKALRESLSGIEKLLGAEHPDTIMNLGHLAEVVRGQCRYEEAEAIYLRTLKGKEDHPSDDLIAMQNMDNLGSVLRDAGRLEEADSWVRRAFMARERVTGHDSLPTLGSVSHLALILRLRGNFDEAETMNKRALAGFEKTLGREHHFTLRSLDDLSVVFRCQNKLHAAEEQNRRALKGLSKVLGPSHRRTLASTKHLALILQFQGRYAQSEVLLKSVIEAQERHLGPRSSQTLESLRDLEHVVQEREKYAEREMRKLNLGGV